MQEGLIALDCLCVCGHHLLSKDFCLKRREKEMKEGGRIEPEKVIPKQRVRVLTTRNMFWMCKIIFHLIPCLEMCKVCNFPEFQGLPDRMESVEYKKITVNLQLCAHSYKNRSNQLF